jgi:hypothetical protein
MRSFCAILYKDSVEKGLHLHKFLILMLDEIKPASAALPFGKERQYRFDMMVGVPQRVAESCRKEKIFYPRRE